MPDVLERAQSFLDRFDFSSAHAREQLMAAITYDLQGRECDIMTQRISLAEGTTELTLCELSPVHRTSASELAAIESRLATHLTHRGIPLKA